MSKSKIQQLRDSKGHFLTVEKTREVIAKQFVDMANNEWKKLSWQASKSYGTLESYIRTRFSTRQGKFANIKWDQVKNLKKQTADA